MKLRGAAIALIEHPRNPSASAGLQRILALGADVILVVPRAHLAPRDGRLRVLVCPTDSADAICGALMGLRRRPDAVLSFSHHFCAVAARVARRLRVRGFDAPSLGAMEDKRHVRRLLADQPSALSHWLLSGDDDLFGRASELPYPVVVKPTGETSSTNVSLVTTQAEFVQAARRVREMRATRKGTPLDGTALIEEYADGPEWSVELSDATGLNACYGVTAKSPLPEHPFIEQADTFPVVDSVAGKVAKAALDAVRAFPAYGGPTHVEVRSTAAGPKLIEINGRQPGGYIPDLIRWTTGRDVFVDAVSRLLDVQPTTEEPVAGAATWWQIYAPRAGTVVACELPEQHVGGALRVATLRRGIGEAVFPPRDNHGRVGDLVVLGDSPAESLSRAREMASRVRLILA